MRLTSRFSSTAFLCGFLWGEFMPLLIWIAGRYLCLAAVGLWSLFPGCLSDPVWQLSLDLFSPVSKQQSWIKFPYSQNHLWPSGGGMNGVPGREGRLKREGIYIYNYDWHAFLYSRNQHNIVKQFSNNYKAQKVSCLFFHCHMSFIDSSVLPSVFLDPFDFIGSTWIIQGPLLCRSSDEQLNSLLRGKVTYIQVQGIKSSTSLQGNYSAYYGSHLSCLFKEKKWAYISFQILYCTFVYSNFLFLFHLLLACYIKNSTFCLYYEIN